MTDERRIPVLIGGGQFTQRTAQAGRFEESLSPMGLLVEAASRALADTHAADRVRAALDAVAVIRFTVDAVGTRLPMGSYRNAPQLLGKELGLKDGRRIYTATGGNTPQATINRLADAIAAGEITAALVAGCEGLATLMGAAAKGTPPEWPDASEGEPEAWWDEKDGVDANERRHGLALPANTYPLIEQAIRAKRGRSIAAHQAAMGALFAPFTQVAAANPHAWFSTARTADEIATPGEKNRYVGFPYTKYMNAVIQVDQSAAVIVTSVAEARARGVPESRWVWLAGGADAHDIWHVTQRPDLAASPAIRTIAREAFAQARLTPSGLDALDIYSCFPSAVEIACAEIGLAEDDPRGLTVTGGLPYFGGPGNNYAMHAIVTMMDRLRAGPGRHGLVTANGWFITKHALGLYSTAPVTRPWERRAPAAVQADVDRLAPKIDVDPAPTGTGIIETWTVVHDREGPLFGILLGHLEGGRRFVANTAKGREHCAALLDGEWIGRTVPLAQVDGKTIATVSG